MARGGVGAAILSGPGLGSAQVVPARPVTKRSVSLCRRRRKASLTKSSFTPRATRWSETPYVVSYRIPGDCHLHGLREDPGLAHFRNCDVYIYQSRPV